MITVQVRKQGGAAIMTIPADILKILNIDVGSALELDVTDQGLVLRPLSKANRRHYSLAELLKGATPKNIKKLNEKTRWARDGKSVGRELT